MKYQYSHLILKQEDAGFRNNITYLILKPACPHFKLNGTFDISKKIISRHARKNFFFFNFGDRFFFFFYSVIKVQFDFKRTSNSAVLLLCKCRYFEILRAFTFSIYRYFFLPFISSLPLHFWKTIFQKKFFKQIEQKTQKEKFLEKQEDRQNLGSRKTATTSQVGHLPLLCNSRKRSAR